MRVKWFVSLGASLIIGMTIGEASQSGWEKTGNLERVTAVFALAYDDSGHIYAGTEIVGDVGVVFKSRDKGEHWEATGDIPGAMDVFFIIQASDGVLYCGTEDGNKIGRVFKSADYGDTWIQTGALSGAPWSSVYCLLETKDGNIYAGLRDGLYFSTNKGESWSPVIKLRGEWVADMLETPDGTIYVSTNILPGKTAGVYISTDKGKTWVKRISGFEEEYVIAVWSLSYSRDTLYAGTTRLMEVGEDTLYMPRVFKSLNKGHNWIALNHLNPSSPPSPGEGVWAMIKTKRGKLYAGTIWGVAGPQSRQGEGQIFESSDDMNWTFSNSFPEGNGVSSFIQTPDSIVYAGITGARGVTGGVYKNISESGIEEREILFPLSIETHPNPATELTVIRFQLPVKTVVNLKVYDISGRVVRSLIRARSIEPGAYTVEWNGTDEKGKEVPTGVYFIELKTQRDREAKKIVKID